MTPDGDDRTDIVVLSGDGSQLLVSLYEAETGLGCAGDCSRNFVVSIDELILSVSIALGERPASECAAVDRDSSGTVEINELVTAVNRALTGCGP